MKQWIIDHKDSKFTIESVFKDETFGWPSTVSVKLYKMNFWIIEDLLEKI
mgnify:CR=1 FL=1